MQLADAATTAATRPVAPALTTSTVSGWGGRSPVPVTVQRPASLDALRVGVAELGGIRPTGAIARGMGRSYGDAAQLAHGTVLDTTLLQSFELDARAGVVQAEAGVTLGRLLAELAPAGWVLPAVPGTQHASVGGAIASDVHGKNHRTVGTFGSHVRALGLLTAGGEVLTLSREHDGELLAATIGGMGLTGVIVWAAIELHRLPGPLLAVSSDRIAGLDEALSLLAGAGGPHRVAWLDLLGSTPVRGVVTRADSVLSAPGRGIAVRARLTVPERWPAGLLRPEVVRAYNAYRFHRAPGHAVGEVETFGAHMFPLDALGAWPRLYGAAGLVQYQFAVPTGAEHALEQVIGRVRRSGVPCYLAVLKDLGPANAAPLSFPLAGWTLALDLPGAAPGLDALLDACDEVVAEAGGRVYLAKDGRTRADVLAAMYPRLDEWRATRDRIDPERLWVSDLGLRAGLVPR